MRFGRAMTGLMAGSVLFSIVLLTGTMRSSEAEESTTPVLLDTDCVKCHSGPPADIAAAGGAHKFVPCQGCHEGHRPKSKNNIPSCDECHAEEPHFELKGCLDCHQNPHRPKDIILPKNLTDPCLTCHTDQQEQLQANKSKHSAQYCTTCHDVHGKKPQCTDCHSPHSEDMNAGDCRLCHKAHKPRVVTYPDSIPNKMCAACHESAYDLLTASKTKHQTKRCAFCHKSVHKTVPECSSCHGIPHPESILAKFPKCGTCHATAHDLNNWQSTSGPSGKK